MTSMCGILCQMVYLKNKKLNTHKRGIVMKLFIKFEDLNFIYYLMFYATTITMVFFFFNLNLGEHNADRLKEAKKKKNYE